LAAAVPAGEAREDRPARRIVLAQLHSRLPAERMDAVRRLRDFPALEAARLIVPAALIDPAPQVRRVAYETLLTWTDQRDFCDFLITALERESRTRKGSAVAPPLIAALLASELPETQQALTGFLERYASASKDGVVAVAAAADELGQQGGRESLAALEKLMGQKRVVDKFPCRRAVVQGMIQVRRGEAVAVLIRQLGKEDGEVRGDIVRHLTEVTGQAHGIDSRAWQAWWQEHGSGFQFPAQAAGPAAQQVAAPGTPTYYGVSLYARRVVFVLDISGSMKGPRLAAAKRELIGTLESLPGDCDLGIVAFNDHTAAWQRGLVRASPAAKQGAIQFVRNLRAGGNTAAYDALDAAFRFDAEAIYFLSDGQPNAGKISAPGDIVAAVTKANRSRRMSVYTIGIAPGLAGGPLELFVKTLAEQNFGVYRRVDQ
jgi:hypothetical protein